MSAIRQKFRPKHQLLILKCYPHFQKNAVEIKPNSSELSYLLYYASTRRSKLQKVGTFLEEKTRSDVRRGRYGDVQVTLQITTALIDKCPRDLPLYSSSVLAILLCILQSRDINLVEDSVTAFATFCAHYDNATFAADRVSSQQFDDILSFYASFATKSTQTTVKGKQTSVPIAIRFRGAGLSAIKSLVSSDSFGAYNGKHMNIIIPAILDNIHSHRPNHISLLQYRANEKQQYEREQAYRRRQSVSLVRAVDQPQTDAADVSGTTADSDQRADEEVGVLALQSLKAVFAADNRNQIRIATQTSIKFAQQRAVLSKQIRIDGKSSINHRSWTAELFENISQWPPVQDRFIVLVTAMESLIRSPIREDDLEQQLVLTEIISWLLRSSINFIGLSVMDVLIGLVQHILLLLQLGGPGSEIAPHPQQSLRVSPSPSQDVKSPENPADLLSSSAEMEIVVKPSAPRLELLSQLQVCIGDLATHVYYNDQVGDMIAALLLRLKPSQNSAVPSAVRAVEDPEAAAGAIALSVHLQERNQTDGYFSFGTARVLALQAVKRIILVANSGHRDGSAAGRNRVGVSVWEGTQWLLRDSDGRVRKAYVDALLSWSTLELEKKDLKLAEAHARDNRAAKREAELASGSTLAKRAISNASTRLKAQTKARSTFLQLLQLAIFENALQFAKSEPDILLLHLLQVTLIQKLGINSVCVALPMVFALQEEIPNLGTPVEKMSIGSLVHGYFWALSETFEFEGSAAGRQIHAEIIRRSSKGFWIKSVRIPALNLHDIGSPEHPTEPILPPHVDAQMESLRPFDSRDQLIESISESYSTSTFSPPVSPSTSPGRSFSRSTIPHRRSLSAANLVDKSLPQEIKDQMLVHWSRNSCISAVEKENARTVSLNGSKTGSASGNRNVLFPYSMGALNASNDTQVGSRSLGANPINGLNRKLQSSHRSSPIPLSSTSIHSIIRVEELKRILAGETVISSTRVKANDEGIDDTASESLVSDPSLASEHSLSLGTVGQAIDGPPTDMINSSGGIYSNAGVVGGVGEDIPPVPLLPANLKQPLLGTPFGAGIEKQLGAVNLDGQGETQQVSGIEFGGLLRAEDGRLSVRSLLSGIDTSVRRPTSSMGAPPY